MKQAEKLASLTWNAVLRFNSHAKADILVASDYLLRHTDYVSGRKGVMKKDHRGLSSYDVSTVRKLRSKIRMGFHDVDDLLRAAKILFRYRKQLRFDVISGKRC